MLFKNSVGTSKRTPNFTITKINWLTLFKFNPLKTREREREERKVGWVVRDTTFNRGGGRKAMFAAMKVPRQCPLVLLVKVSWIGGKNVWKLRR
jgi:hypothetical protein